MPGEATDKSLSFEQAVKLGLMDVSTGKFRDPQTGKEMPLKTAVISGLVDPSKPAIVDIKTGETFSLSEAFDGGMVNQYTGRVNPKRTQELTLDPQFTGRDEIPSPVNVEDAILSGLLDVSSGHVIHPNTGEKMPLKHALHQGIIDSESA